MSQAPFVRPSFETPPSAAPQDEVRVCGIHPQDHSGLIPVALTTLPHFSVSASTWRPNSSGETTSVVAPRLSKRPLIFGSASVALTARLSRAMASGGVLRGAPIPFHVLDSKQIG